VTILAPPRGKLELVTFLIPILSPFHSCLLTLLPSGDWSAITDPEAKAPEEPRTVIDLSETDDAAGGRSSLSPKKLEQSGALKKVKEELFVQSGEFSVSTGDDLDTVADLQIPADISVRTKVAKLTGPQQQLSSGGTGSSSGGYPPTP
jgi:hypothetical protein